jgi:hypothetical protein
LPVKSIGLSRINKLAVAQLQSILHSFEWAGAG